MSLTLKKLDYEFDESSISNIEKEVGNGIITPSTTIVDTPVKINDFLKELVQGLKNLFEKNLENLAEDFDKWFDEKTDKMKKDIENNLALDPNILYDINVKHAQIANNSKKFNNKTYSEMVSDLYSNYISTATVDNSIHFNGKNMDEYTDYIKNNLKPHASDTDKAFGHSYKELKTLILADVKSNGGGVDLNDVKIKVENEWDAYEAKNSKKFDGDTSDYWKKNIIPKIKIENSINADKLNGHSYDEMNSNIQDSINSKIKNTINKNNKDFMSLIKGIKPDQASRSDISRNAEKFDGYDSKYWKETIIPSIKVDRSNYADNSGSLGGYSAKEWRSEIDETEKNLEENVKTKWVAFKALNVLKINGIDTKHYDDHINKLISIKLNDMNNLDIDANKFDHQDATYWKTKIIPNIKVNNANHAKTADIVGKAVEADHAKALCAMITEEIPPKKKGDKPKTVQVRKCFDMFEYMDYILKYNNDRFFNPSDSIVENYEAGQNLLRAFFDARKFLILKDKNIINNINDLDDDEFYNLNDFKQGSMIKDYDKKEYEFDKSNNIKEISYYYQDIIIKKDYFYYNKDETIYNLVENFKINFYQNPNENLGLIEEDVNDDKNWSTTYIIKITSFDYKNDFIIKQEIKYRSDTELLSYDSIKTLYLD